VAALIAVELRRLWAAATIRAFLSATALDNGQRSPRKLLAPWLRRSRLRRASERHQERRNGVSRD
jgi:hypothetical protein